MWARHLEMQRNLFHPGGGLAGSLAGCLPAAWVIPALLAGYWLLFCRLNASCLPGRWLSGSWLAVDAAWLLAGCLPAGCLAHGQLPGCLFACRLAGSCLPSGCWLAGWPGWSGWQLGRLAGCWRRLPAGSLAGCQAVLRLPTAIGTYYKPDRGL